MKKTTYILFGFFTLTTLIISPAHAASFDCAKASTEVEKMICSNPELSKLDEELDTAYKTALKNSKDSKHIRKAQKNWLKERNAGFNSDYIKYLYENRLSILEIDGADLNSNNDRRLFCGEIAFMIENDTIDKYVANRIDAPELAIGSEYIDLDIDRDGKADKVVYGRGSEESLLEVILSGGGKYDQNESGFMMVVKIKEYIYALVTYWKWDRQPDGSRKGEKVGNRLYRLTSDGAELICDIEDFRGGK